MGTGRHFTALKDPALVVKRALATGRGDKPDRRAACRNRARRECRREPIQRRKIGKAMLIKAREKRCQSSKRWMSRDACEIA